MMNSRHATQNSMNMTHQAFQQQSRSLNANKSTNQGTPAKVVSLLTTGKQATNQRLHSGCKNGGHLSNSSSANKRMFAKMGSNIIQGVSVEHNGSKSFLHTNGDVQLQSVLKYQNNYVQSNGQLGNSSYNTDSKKQHFTLLGADQKLQNPANMLRRSANKNKQQMLDSEGKGAPVFVS